MMNKSYPSKATEFRERHQPVESLDDPRIAEILTREYPLETDAEYDDDAYQQALRMAEGDPGKALQVYQEFRRVWDVMHVIDHKKTDLEQATGLINSFVELEMSRINAILHPIDVSLPPRE